MNHQQMELNDKTQVEVQPSLVTYRTPIVSSTAVIQIILTNWDNPRIVAFIIDSKGRIPMTLFFDEILFYINDAKERLCQ